MHRELNSRIAVAITLVALLLPIVCAHNGRLGSGAIISFEGMEPREYAPMRMQLLFHNETTGEPITLETVHERKAHLFIVSENLATFWHIHPEDYHDGLDDEYRGVYRAGPMYFPHAGRYLLGIDYTVSGRTYLQLENITVRGDSKGGTIPVDRSTTQQIGEYTISLTTERPLRSGEQSMMTFTILKEGIPVSDLELYLGAETHVVIARSDLSDVAHEHAFIPGHALHTMAMPQRYSGPAIPVRHTFTEPGTYAIYAQFKHDGKVITSRFLVEVRPMSAIPPRSIGLGIAAAVIIVCAIAIWKMVRKE